MFLIAGPHASMPNVALPDPPLATLLDALATPTALLDGNGRIAQCNAAWRALGDSTSTFGDLGTLVTQADHVGTGYVRRLAALEGPLASAAHRLAREIQEVQAGRRQVAHVDYRRRRPEGEAAVEAVVSPLPSPSGTLVLLQHIDVSERERAADLQEAAVRFGIEAETERARQRALLQRLASLGRDVHTPITPVRLQLHLLATQALGPLTDAQRNALEMIERNVQRWADGEQALLALPSQEWPPAQAFDLAEAAAKASERLFPKALAQGIQLVQPHAGAPLPVKAIASLVIDVVEVLIGRALEASSAGSTVAVEVGSRDGEAYVEVHDSGAGATAREVRDLFEPWGGHRPSAQAQEPFQLPYAKEAMQTAGGRVYAESDGPGTGLLIGLALPLASA